MSTLPRQPRGWRVLGFSALGLSALALSGCTIPTGEDPTVAESTTSTTSSSKAPAPTRGEEAPSNAAEPPAGGAAETSDLGISNAQLESAVADVSARFNAQVGVVVGQGSGALRAGSIDGASQPSWSTVKVPIAIAALRESPDAATASAARAAISSSNNETTDQLWQQLGGGASAAGKVAGVIREFGGGDVSVPTEQTRAGFSAYGQARWTLKDQAEFAAGLIAQSGKDPATEQVWQYMGQIDPGHSYGLGRAEGAVFKGGWGPGETGAYLVRQLGALPLKEGLVPVAIAAEAADGSYEMGQQVLDALVEHLLQAAT